MNSTPQGWYHDPADPSSVRWFDGQAWTEHRQAAPPVVAAPTQLSSPPVQFSPAASQWQLPPATPRHTSRTVLIVLACVLVGLFVVSILAAIAIPVFLDQRAKANAAELGLTDITCQQVASDALQLPADGQVPLLAMDGLTLDSDQRATVQVPAAGTVAFVMSCHGTGTKPDGTTAPVTASLFIDSTRQLSVAYVWDS